MGWPNYWPSAKAMSGRSWLTSGDGYRLPAIIVSVERRRDGQERQTPIALLKELPALVVLERIPVPVLAAAEDGIILFGNAAFAEMLGYSAVAVTSLEYQQIFHTPPCRTARGICRSVTCE